MESVPSASADGFTSSWFHSIPSAHADGTDSHSISSPKSIDLLHNSRQTRRLQFSIQRRNVLRTYRSPTLLKPLRIFHDIGNCRCDLRRRRNVDFFDQVKKGAHPSGR